jgi:hypothetical protein
MLPGVIAASASATQPNGTAMTFGGSAAKPIKVPEKTTADSHLSLGRGIDHILQTTGADGFTAISPLEKSIFDWHIANLEYGCATDLARVSLEHWDQVRILLVSFAVSHVRPLKPCCRTTNSSSEESTAC